MNDADSELIGKARNGDPAAFREIIDLYSSRIHAIAYQMTGNSDDAQDIAQEVFFKLYRSLKKFDTNQQFMTWLYRMTINLSIDFHRKNIRHRHVSFNEIEESSVFKDSHYGPDESIEQKELRGAIYRLTGELSVKQRKVFILKDIHGFSTEEIGQILKCSRITVRVHIAKARLKIKTLLFKYYPALVTPNKNHEVK